MMEMNKYLFGIIVLFLVVTMAFSIATAYRTKVHKNIFKDAYQQVPSRGTLYNMHITNLDSFNGKAEVLYIETHFRKDYNFQIGRLVKFEKKEDEDGWTFVSDKKMWDERNNEGNEFTFPPYTGKDKTVLLKK